jgi:hypothetical protein
MERIKKHYVSILGLVLALSVLSGQARADLFGFDALSNYSGDSAAIAPQLVVNVTESGGDALFSFYNNWDPLTLSQIVPDADGPIGVITNIFFMGGDSLLTNGYVDGDSGATVAFTSGSTSLPTDLQGLGFASALFTATAEPPRPTNGVGFYPDYGLEYVTVGFDLLGGIDIEDVFSALGDKSLLIGLHVQAIGPDSDWFVTPVPGAVLLGLLGLGVAGWKLRRFA